MNPANHKAVKVGKLILLISLLAWFSSSFPVFGDMPATPYSHSVISRDNRFVFVMIAPGSLEHDAWGSPENIKADARRIRAKYQISGLYLNDGGTTPLWSVDWYAHQVFVSSDGVHLVRRGPWASDGSNEALTFYENGKEIRSYQVRDLVDSTWFLPHTVSHFTWAKTIELDDARRTLEVITEYGDRYSFDLVTGKIVHSWRRTRILAASGLIVVAVLVILSAMFVRRRMLRRASSKRVASDVA